jgi:hypothetical protein
MLKLEARALESSIAAARAKGLNNMAGKGSDNAG